MDSIQQPSVLAMPFANNGTKNNIPASPTGTNKASLSEGFPQITSTAIASGGVPPSRADFNALGNISTLFYYFMQCGGGYTFRADVSSTIGGYPKGALLWYIPATGSPIIVVSAINNNTNNFNTDQSVIGEAGSGKPWEIVTVSPQNFMDLTTNQTAGGTKTFSSSPVIPTPSTSDNSTKSASTAYVKNNLSGAVSTITTSNLTASRALISNSSGKIAVSSITSTKLGYLSDVTSNIQAQINAKPSVSSVIGFPDYANATDLAKENGTIATDGYLYMRSTIYTQLIINGLQFDIGYAASQGGDLMIPVKAGDTYSSANWGSMGVFKHIPFRS